MRSPLTRLTSRSAMLIAVALFAAGCGSPGSSDGGGSKTAATSQPPSNLAVCEAVPGETLVELEDDKNLQNPENLLPAANADFASKNPALLTTLEPLVDVLDTEALIQLNKAVLNDRQTSAQAAKAFVAEHNLDEADSAQVGDGATVIVGSPDFAEGATVAAVYVEMLNAAGFKASTQDVGNRELYLTDLTSGDISLMPEYVSSLTEFLNIRANGDDGESAASSDLDATVTALTDLAVAEGITVGKPTPAQDQNAYAVTKGFAEKHGLKTISDLATKCGQVKLGGPPECPERTFCQKGLIDVYAIDFDEFTSLDVGGPLTKAALRKGDITLGMVTSSDADLAN